MRRICIAMMALAFCVAPAFALMGKPNKVTEVVNTEGTKVSGKDADVAVKAAADAVLAQAEAGKVKEATANNLANKVDTFTDKRAFHPGLGIGGNIELGGDVGADLLFTLRKEAWMTVVSVGYNGINDSIKEKDFDTDKVKFGLGIVHEF